MDKNKGELIGDIIPLVIFIYLALVVGGIIKPKREIPFLNNPSVLIKFIVFGGVVVSIILLAIGLFK